MEYTLIDKNGPYALILRGESMTQYAVVSGLDKKAGSWDWTCCYYDFGKFSGLTKPRLFSRHWTTTLCGQTKSIFPGPE